MVLIFYIYYIYLQNPSFSNKKALQQKAKGLEMSGSTYWISSELIEFKIEIPSLTY